MSTIRRLRVKGKVWCWIEIEVRAGYLSICGAIGDVMTRRELHPDDEIWMVNSRRVFVVSGCGQITEELSKFFPECIPHLRYHGERGEEIKATLRWADKFCSPKQMERIERWRDNAAERNTLEAA